ncbi:unnamed protein product, partial [marine sediment metagenome]
MPSIFHFSIDFLLKELQEIQDLNIPGILLFGLPEKKDEVGSGAYDPEGIIQKAVAAIKARFPDLIVITDICMCEY